jgi:hypothetical protein
VRFEFPFLFSSLQHLFYDWPRSVLFAVGSATSGNIFSLPFSVQVINPVQLITIIRQPSGSVNTAVAIPVQPRLFLSSSGPSIVGQLVQASADESCTAGVSLLFGACTVLPDSTCTFQNLAVVGIFNEVNAWK